MYLNPIPVAETAEQFIGRLMAILPNTTLVPATEGNQIEVSTDGAGMFTVTFPTAEGTSVCAWVTLDFTTSTAAVTESARLTSLVTSPSPVIKADTSQGSGIIGPQTWFMHPIPFRQGSATIHIQQVHALFMYTVSGGALTDSAMNGYFITNATPGAPGIDFTIAEVWGTCFMSDLFANQAVPVRPDLDYFNTRSDCFLEIYERDAGVLFKGGVANTSQPRITTEGLQFFDGNLLMSDSAGSTIDDGQLVVQLTAMRHLSGFSHWPLRVTIDSSAIRVGYDGVNLFLIDNASHESFPLEATPELREVIEHGSHPIDTTKRLIINTPTNAAITDRPVKDLIADGTLTGEFVDAITSE